MPMIPNDDDVMKDPTSTSIDGQWSNNGSRQNWMIGGPIVAIFSLAPPGPLGSLIIYSVRDR